MCSHVFAVHVVRLLRKPQAVSQLHKADIALLLLLPAQAILLHTSQLPPEKAAVKLQRMMQPLLGPSSSAAADPEVADLLSAALDAQYSTSLTTLSPQASASTGQPASSAGAAQAAAGSFGAGSGGEQGSSNLNDALLEVLRERAAAAVGKLRDFVRGASLVTVAPGEHTQRQWKVSNSCLAGLICQNCQ
jgi:hypothetical protein